MFINMYCFLDFSLFDLQLIIATKILVMDFRFFIFLFAVFVRAFAQNPQDVPRSLEDVPQSPEDVTFWDLDFDSDPELIAHSDTQSDQTQSDKYNIAICCTPESTNRVTCTKM